MACLFSAFWNLPAGLERHRAVAVRTSRVARSGETRSGSPSTQNVRGTAARPGSDRMAAGEWSLESGVERVGVSGFGHRRVGAAVVSPARSRDARSTPRGVDGANPIGASGLFPCRDRYGTDEGAIRSENTLAGSLSAGVALIDDAARNSVDVLSRVDRLQRRRTAVLNRGAHGPNGLTTVGRSCWPRRPWLANRPSPIAVQITIRAFLTRARLTPAAEPRPKALVARLVPASSTPSHIGTN